MGLKIDVSNIADAIEELEGPYWRWSSMRTYCCTRRTKGPHSMPPRHDGWPACSVAWPESVCPGSHWPHSSG